MQTGPTKSLIPPGDGKRSGTPILEATDIRQRLPVARLPMMPQVLTRLLDACFAEGADVDQLASIVALDPGIAARVITAACASTTEERARPASLARCVALADPGLIKAIAVNESANRVFGHPRGNPQPELVRHWLHALKCALLARILAAELGYPDREEAYLAGLLHDIGALALSALGPAGRLEHLSLARGEKDRCRLELDLYQATHADVGSWLAEAWRLDSFLADSIRYHHEAAEQIAAAHPLIRIVALADRLSHLDIAQARDEENEFARLCAVPVECLTPLMRQANENLNAIAADLGIVLDNAGHGSESIGQAAASAGELECKLEDRLLIDSALSLAAGAADLDASLKGIAEAAMVLFGLQPSLFFLRDGQSDAFVGRAWLPRHARADQLRFVAGQADSAASLAVTGVPAVWLARDGRGKPLDAQLARLLEAEGVVCIPMGAGPQCKGIVVSAINSRYHADTLDGKIDILRSFGKLAESMLARASAGTTQPIAEAASAGGASPEQVRHLLHEVSNPLSIVRNYLSTLEMSLEHSAAGKKELRIVTEEIDRISQILDQFRRLPRDPATAEGPAPLHDLIQGVLDLCKGSRMVPPLVDIQVNLDAPPPALVAHHDKLKQILLNLLKNAFEAMPDGGKLKVSTCSWGDGRDGNHVEIVLEDSGPGLPDEIRRSLYRPVASLKGGRHLGVGLSIVGQLVREMNGLINCRSDQDGSCFRIMLPLVTP